ncbi:MAG: transglutaminase domain-containing protein [Candidatus Nanopelagicales bacterium]
MSIGAAPLLLSANVQTSTHADGLPHVRSTIGKMAALSRAGSATYPIRNLATRIVADVPSKQYALEVATLYRWVRDNIRYRKDPRGVEWLQSPERTVRERAGDCDDIATLLAAFIQALGHETRFHTVGKSRDVQEHVAVEALIDGNWLSVDPVLEPAALSTAPRADLGKFGQRAPGARINWSSEGSMLSGGRVGRRARMLAGPVGARQRKLWDWNPYFPPVGVGQRSGMQIAAGGRPAAANHSYRSDDSVAFWGNRNLRSLAAQSGNAVSPVARPLSGLGEGWSFGQMRVTTSDVAALRNYVQKGGTFLSHANQDPTAQARIFANAKRVLSDDYYAASQWAQLSRDRRNWVRNHYGPPKGLEKFASSAVHFVEKVGSSLPAKILAPVFAQNVDPKLRAVQDTVLSKIPLPQAQALRAAGASVAQIVDHARAVQAMPAAAQAVVHKAATLSRRTVPPGPAWKAPHPKLASKYPAHARQVFDAKHSVFRVYVPKKKKKALSGLGAFRPTISFALGAAQSGSSSSMGALAQSMVNAVAAFTSKNGHPPQVKLAAVTAFQNADPQLSNDGLYGPNAQTAAAYYLGTSTSKLPGFAAPYAKYPVTWRAPSSSAPVAAPAASTPKALAMNAVNAVRAFKTPPTQPLPAVLAFQRADDLLLDDGKYGPNVQLAAAYYLGVPTSSLPPFAPAFKNTKITWHPPGTVTAPTPKKPAPAAKAPSKPVAARAPAPAAHPMAFPAAAMPAQTAQHAAARKPSSSASKAPPLALPGYTEVGQEHDNPGLPPVPASSSSTPGQHTVTTPSGGKIVQLDPVVITGRVPKHKPARKPAKTAKPRPRTAPATVAPSGGGMGPNAAPATAYDLPAPSDDAMYTSPAATYADSMPELGPPPIPAGSSYADFEAGAAQQGPTGSSDSGLGWLALFYLWAKQHRKAA